MKELLVKDFQKQKKNIISLGLVWIFLVLLFLFLIKKGIFENGISTYTNIPLFTVIILQDLMKNEKIPEAYAKTYVDEKLVFSMIIVAYIFLLTFIGGIFLNSHFQEKLIMKDFLLEAFVYCLLAFTIANLGIFFHIKMGEGSFLLSIILNFIAFLLLIVFLFGGGSLMNISSLRKIVIFLLLLLALLALNFWFRNLSVKAVKKISLEN
jgi:hypothetical protein